MSCWRGKMKPSLSLNELGEDEFEIVVPSLSILAEPPVAVVDKVVKKKGTEEVAKAYLEYLYTEIGQEIAAKHYYRPRNEDVLKKYADQFPTLTLSPLTMISVVGKKPRKLILMTAVHSMKSIYRTNDESMEKFIVL